MSERDEPVRILAGGSAPVTLHRALRAAASEPGRSRLSVIAERLDAAARALGDARSSALLASGAIPIGGLVVVALVGCVAAGSALPSATRHAGWRIDDSARPSVANNRALPASGAGVDGDRAAPPPETDESALLLEARRELDRSPVRTLALVRAHRRLYPASALEEERAVLEIEGLARADEINRARALALRFQREFPRSIHADTVRRSTERASAARDVGHE